MVLLTSSTISVAISSSIICTFTFLLFMSGYVMQQQTVKSLQDALHAPPVPKPTPTLPPQFQKPTAEDVLPVVEVATIVTGEGDRELGIVDEGLPAEDSIKTVVETASNLYSAEDAAIVLSQNTASNPPSESPPTSVQVVEDATPNEAASTITAGSSNMAVPSPASASELSEPSESAPSLRLAYVFTVAQPSQICSALLFFRQHSQSHNNDNTNARPTYLLLYPSRWETDPSHEAYTTALTLMRVAQDSLDIIYHPVRTTEAWAGLESASTQSQLLGELQRYHWAFDRMLYLKTPGLATDIAALDAALSTTSASLRRNWVSLSKTSSTSREATNPSVMLLSAKGILVPRGELRGRLTVSAATGSHVDRHASEMDVEATSKSAAYVYFNQEELEHRREEKEWYDGVFERYERGVNEVCKGSIFDREKGELRRI
jgi:hypothetical protein